MHDLLTYYSYFSVTECAKKTSFFQTRVHCSLISCQSLVTTRHVRLLHLRRINRERSLSDERARLLAVWL